MDSQFIITVTEANFEYEVINFSQKTPVVVDFWAEWCVPCKMLDPILQKLAKESGGVFRLAKVNVDENQNLAMRFNIRGIPMVKAFRDGNIVAEFSGVQPETKIEQFLSDIIPTPLDLNLNKANSLLKGQKWQESSATFRQVLEARPGHPNALLGLSKTLLAQGRAKEARDILKTFPVSAEYASAEKLFPLTFALLQLEDADLNADDPNDATFKHTLKLVALGNLPSAMDGILEVLKKEKDYRDGEAKRVIMSIFEILGTDNPLTRQYRSELASILF